MVGLIDPEARCPLMPLNCLWGKQYCLPGLGGEWGPAGPGSLHPTPSRTLSTLKATLRDVPRSPELPSPGEGVLFSQTEDKGGLEGWCCGQCGQGESVAGIERDSTGGHAVFQKVFGPQEE